jgi:hypothetical protein
VVGDEVLGALRDPSEVADTELLDLAQSAGEHQPCGVCERSSASGGAFGLAHVEPAGAQSLGHFEVKTEKLAAVVCHRYILTFVEMFLCIVALGSGLSWGAMSLQALRGRMPLLAFILLAILCLALFGFACACVSDQPLQALERALGGIPALPALVEVWSLVALLALASAMLATAPKARARAPSPALLQRFLL